MYKFSLGERVSCHKTIGIIITRRPDGGNLYLVRFKKKNKEKAYWLLERELKQTLINRIVKFFKREQNR